MNTPIQTSQQWCLNPHLPAASRHFNSALADSFRTAPLDLFEAFDENDLEAQIQSFWSSLHRDFGPVPVDEKAFEKEIELGLWAYWLGHKIRVGGRWTVVKWIAGSYEGISLPVLKRLHELKLITESEKQGIYFEADRWSQHVFQRLEKWGANWRPSRVFGKS